MKILIIEGPGQHPESYARSLGGALLRLGHVAIVHPLRKTLGSWGVKHYVGREAKKIVEAHQPDIIHVISSEPWVADSFVDKGVPVLTIHDSVRIASQYEQKLINVYQESIEKVLKFEFHDKSKLLTVDREGISFSPEQVENEILKARLTDKVEAYWW